MKKKILLFVALAYQATSATAQNTEVRQLPSFTKIVIESSAKIYLRQDTFQSVKVTTDDILKDVETDVSGQTLHINGSSDGELNITIPHIEKLSIRGNGEVISQSALQTDNLSLDISGNGKMNLEVNVKELKITISGLGKVILKGTAENTTVDISGSGKIDAGDLKTVSCKANISGLGKCIIDVTENLTTDISGSGTVTYKNAPKNINQSISGLGKINSYDETGNKSDTTKMNFGDSQVIIISKKNHSYYYNKWKKQKPKWQGFEMGINSYMNSNGNFDLPPGYEFLELKTEKSVSVGLNLLQKNIQLGQSNVWFFTGLGVSWNNYRFSDNVTLIPSSGPISATTDTTSNVHYIKSKLTAIYLTAPIMFEAFTSRNPKKAFHIGAGALVGLKVGAHTKQKYEIDDETFKSKVFNDFGLNPFRFGTRVAVGFNHLNIYADYYFTPLFKSGRGPTMYPVNIGITLLGF